VQRYVTTTVFMVMTLPVQLVLVVLVMVAAGQVLGRRLR
jgi:hypothetical protein